MPRIVMHSPDPAWPGEFQTLKSALLPLLPKTAIIHHIGSTAVPGLAAKNIIDIQVSVDTLDAVDRPLLEAAGFPPVARLVSDHCPPALDLEPAELAKLLVKATIRPANIHIREKGRFNQRFALLCRDYLHTHPIAARAYEQVKTALAHQVGDDADSYYAIKDPVFDIIIEGANEWALRTGWTQPPGD
jgi:GrpB-like predicted nucleotidyltransferase (UPF0157 family)